LIKIVIIKFDKNKNIGEHCNFSTNFLGGWKIAKEEDEILPKVLPKL